MLQCVAVCCSVLQCAAVCCSVLHLYIHTHIGTRPMHLTTLPSGAECGCVCVCVYISRVSRHVRLFFGGGGSFLVFVFGVYLHVCVCLCVHLKSFLLRVSIYGGGYFCFGVSSTLSHGFIFKLHVHLKNCLLCAYLYICIRICIYIYIHMYIHIYI